MKREFRRKKEIKQGLVVFALLFVAIVGYVAGKPMVALAREPEAFRSWVEAKGIWGQLAFVGMVVVQIVVALIPGEPFEIAAGYAFGVWRGLGLCLAGMLIGSAIVFALTHRFGIRLALLFFTEEQLKKIPTVKGNARNCSILFFLMVLPGTPKDLLSYGAGLTDVSFWHWMAIVAVSRIPSVITSILAGDALGTKRYGLTAAVFAVTLVISAVGLWIYNRYSNKK